MTDERRYRKFIRTIHRHSSKQFLQVRESHIRFLDGDCNAAVILTWYINLLRMKDRNPRDQERLRRYDLWMKCPVKSTRSRYRMTEDRHRSALRHLVSAELIEARRRAGNVLWVRVSDATLRRIAREGWDDPNYYPDVEKAQNKQKREKPVSGNGEPKKREKPVSGNGENRNPIETGKPRGYIYKNPSKNPDEHCSPEANGVREKLRKQTLGAFPAEEEAAADEFGRNIAAYLYAELKKLGLIRRRPNMEKWAKRFTDEVTVTMDRLELAREGAEEHLWGRVKHHVARWKDGGKHQPELLCADSICDGIVRLENAERRWKQATGEDVADNVW